MTEWGPFKPTPPAIHRELRAGRWSGYSMAVEASAGASAPQRVGQWQAVKDLLPHLWTRIGWDLRTRVMAAVGCLVIAKLANVYVPILFKGMVDALTPKIGAGAATATTVVIAV